MIDPVRELTIRAIAHNLDRRFDRQGWATIEIHEHAIALANLFEPNDAPLAVELANAAVVLLRSSDLDQTISTSLDSLGDHAGN